MLLRGGLVIDGTGSAPRRADVLVDGDRIVAVSGTGELRASATSIVDVGGRIVAPGFIDMHAHSDLQLLAASDHEAKVTQGVTLEVIGQDGLSYAPVDDDTLAQMRQQIAGWNDDPAGFEYSWRSVEEYLDRLDHGIAVNAIYLVPQGTVRRLVVGPHDRPATADEVERMCHVIERGMQEGAAGLSAGLTYTPGMYADSTELLALLRTTGRLGGYFSTHHRSYGVGAVEAYAEMIDLCERADCALHLTHATLNFTVNRGRAPELIALLDAAADRGLDLTIDTYPYLAGATTLASMLPSWATAGGPAATVDRLLDPAQRERIRHEMEVVGADGCHGVPVPWEAIVISGVSRDDLRSNVGRSIAEIGADEGRGPSEVCFDLLLADELRTGILQLIGNEENVRALMSHPTHCVGSDAILVGDRPHPRAWGTFPRYLGHYAREEGVLGLADCVHHMTGRPARRLGLRDRGFIRPGQIADLVVFDPDAVADTGTYEHPRQRCVGIELVLVSGRHTVRDGQPTGELPGRSLRRRGPGVIW